MKRLDQFFFISGLVLWEARITVEWILLAFNTTLCEWSFFVIHSSKSYFKIFREWSDRSATAAVICWMYIVHTLHWTFTRCFSEIFMRQLFLHGGSSTEYRRNNMNIGSRVTITEQLMHISYLYFRNVQIEAHPKSLKLHRNGSIVLKISLP